MTQHRTAKFAVGPVKVAFPHSCVHIDHIIPGVEQIQTSLCIPILAMARSGLRSWPRPFRGCLPLLCLMWLAVSGALSSLSFVNGVTWGGQWDAKQRVTKRFGEQQQSLPENITLPAGTVEKMAKSLTTRIFRAESAKGLLIVLDEALDGTIFNFFHASAAYCSLAKWKARGKRGGLHRNDWKGRVMDRLHTRVEEMVKKGELDAQATANVLWSIAKFSAWPGIPKELVFALAESIPTKVNDMNPQALSNCLWADAQLKEVAPAALEAVPAIVAQIPDKAKDMNEQQLSNCLLASAHLKNVAPDVLQVVLAISAEIPDKAKDMLTQALSNSLWACAQLKDVAPDVLHAVPAMVAEIPHKARDMKPQELSNCLWVALQLEADAPEVLEIVPIIVMEAQSKIKDMNAQDLSNILEAIVPLQKLFPEVTRLVADGDSEEDIIRSAAARLNILLPRLKRKEDLFFAVPVVVWACAKLGLHNRQLMNSVALRFGSRAKMSSLPGFGVCALSWSYQELDAHADYTDFRELLGTEAAKRRFSQADVESCQLGRSDWSGAKRR